MFGRFAGALAILAGLTGLAYSIVFVATTDGTSRFAEGVEAALLLAGGLLATAVFTALYERLRATDAGFALWGLVLGVGGGLGAAVHGAYNLGVVVDETEAVGGSDLPNAVDPRGFLTFGVTALAVAVFSWLILREGTLPRRLGQLGLVTAVLLAILWVGRLSGLDADDELLLLPALLAGFVASPGWYIWLGRELRR